MVRSTARSLSLFLLSGLSLAFYAKTDVVELTEATWKSQVIDSNDFWLIEFYAPWCGHCKSLVPEWTKAAAALKGVVKVGAVDMTAHQSVGTPYGVQSFPTLKLFGADKKKPIDYEGGRTSKDIASFALKEVKGAVSKRLGLKGKDKDEDDAAPKKEKKQKAAVELNEKTFKEALSSDDIWLVSFYAPWCGHCKALHPIWEQAATKLAGKAKFGAVDATKHTTLAQTYDVKGYPTIKVFQKGQDVKEYNGQRTVNDLATYIASLSGEKVEAPPAEAPEAEDQDTEVVTLTVANFDELVVNSPDVWMVEFFAPWCGHCKNLVPHWKQAASELKGKVKLGAVDVTAHEALGKKYQISGYPTIKAFTPGTKDEPVVYEGGRTSSSIVDYAQDLYNEAKNPLVISEITGEDVFAKCSETSLCLVAFLPHILDTGVEGRKEYLNLLTSVGTKFRKNSLTVLWAEAVSQPGLERVLDIGGSGYPAASLLSAKKQRAVNFLGQLSASELSDFVRRSIAGKEKTVPWNGVPKIESVQAWDPSKPVETPPHDHEEL